MAAWYQWDGEVLLLQLRVQPRASRDEIVGPHGSEALKVRITAPPLEGRANSHLLRFIARSFGVNRSQVTMLSGEGSRNKRLCINNPKQFPDACDIPPTTDDRDK